MGLKKLKECSVKLQDMGKVSLKQAEALLEKKFLNKYIEFHYLHYKAVIGKVDSISIDTSKPDPLVVIQMNEKRYSCSVNEFKNCVKLLNSKA